MKSLSMEAAALVATLGMLGAACGNGDATFGDSGWITSNSSTATTGSGGAGGSGDGGGGEGGNEVAETEAYYFGEATVTPGTSYAGTHGFLVVTFQGEEETVHCEASWSATQLAPLDDCTICDFAFEVSYQGVNVEVDDNGACAAAGFDPAMFEGTTERLGYATEQLMVYDGMAWAAEPETEAGFDAGELYFERYVELEER